MAGDIQFKSLSDEFIKKICPKWSKRHIMQAVFGSQDLLQTKIGAVFGQFISFENLFVLRAYPVDQIQDSEYLYIHQDLMVAFSEEMDKNTTSCNPIKSYLNSCSKLHLTSVIQDQDCANENQETISKYVKNCLMDMVVLKNGLFIINYYGKTLKFKVKDIGSDKNKGDLCQDLSNLNLKTSTPVRQVKNEPQIVTEATEILIDSRNDEEFKKKVFIGGYDKELEIIFKQIDSCQKSYAGFLIYGPSGSGKSLLAQAIISKLEGYKLIQINGSEIFSRYAGETEQHLKTLLSSHQNQNSVIFMDEFDALVSSAGNTDQERRVSACLKSLFDDQLNSKNDDYNKTIVIAVTSRPEFIDTSFRRSGRLEIEIELGVPDFKQRTEIVKAILERSGDLVTSRLNDNDIEFVSRNAHGYVGADLEAVLAQVSLSSDHNRESLLKALKTVRPSAMRELQVNVPNVTWEDIGGLDDLKLKLKQAVEWPIKRPEIFLKMGITPPKGVLMYGPPGCSKTMIAKALANESNLNFLAIKGPELFKKYVGESEQAVRLLFKRARRVAPCIIFFDEIDALGSERGTSGSSKVGDRVLAQMLTEMDGIEQLKDVIVIAATNRPDMIDKALIRPGRLDRLVYVPLPDKQTRLKIFQIHTRKKPLEDTIDLENLASRTEHYSGAEIAEICNEAALATLEETLKSADEKNDEKQNDVVCQRHFDEALDRVKPRLNSSLLSIYDKFRASRNTS